MAGLYKNVEQAKLLFPGWEVRIYMNSSAKDSLHIKKIRHYFPDVKFCLIEDEAYNKQLAMTMARFIPLTEPNVDYVLSLDLDSYLTEDYKKLDEDNLVSQAPATKKRRCN